MGYFYPINNLFDNKNDLSNISAKTATLQAILQQGDAVPPSDALVAIESQAPHLVQAYLEAALDAGIAQPELFHQKLAEMYLADLITSHESSTVFWERSILKERQSAPPVVERTSQNGVLMPGQLLPGAQLTNSESFFPKF